MNKIDTNFKFLEIFSDWEIELAASLFLEELNVDSLPLKEDMNAKLKTALRELQEWGHPEAIVFCLETLSSLSSDFISEISE